MEFAKILFVIVEVLVSLMLAGIILLQKSKNEGLGLAFGSGMGESLFGARAGNVLTKATIVLGIVFLANTVLLGVLFAQRGASESSLADEADKGAPQSGVVVDNTAAEDGALLPDTAVDVDPAAEIPAGTEIPMGDAAAESVIVDTPAEAAPVAETPEEM